MNITTLSIENVKRLSAIRITADGKPIVLTGNNGAGKSSVLDGILLALSGAGLEDPIKHGATRAVIKLKIEGKEEAFNIERIIRPGSRELKVTSADGKPISSPQRFLDSLVGSIAFDPLEFVRLKPKAQADSLRSLLGIDTTAIERKKADFYAERTVVNRLIENLKGQLDGIPEHAADVPDEEVSASDLIKQRDEVGEQAGKRNALEKTVASLEEKKAELNSRLAKGRALIAQLEQELQSASAEAESRKLDLTRQGTHCDSLQPIDSITRKIASVDLTNQAVREKRRRKEVEKALAESNAKSEELTQKQKDADAEKARLLSEADLPVPGMEINEDGVTVDGVRFDQLSTAQQITTSTKIAMRSNPKLKIILIREGALINRANTEALCELAKERGYQLWMEKFSEDASEKGIHISDGEIVAVDGKEVG